MMSHEERKKRNMIVREQIDALIDEFIQRKEVQSIEELTELDIFEEMAEITGTLKNEILWSLTDESHEENIELYEEYLRYLETFVSDDDEKAEELARNNWGDVVNQLKLADGIWYYKGKRHSGIVTDMKKRPDTKFLKDSAYRKKGRKEVQTSEQRYAAFEIDVDACMIEWLYASEILTEQYMRIFLRNTSMTVESWANQRLEHDKMSIHFWTPKLLNKYPDPNMGTYNPEANR